MEIGTILSDDYIVTSSAITRIEATYPIKYDGMNDYYYVCDPDVATHILLVCVDAEDCEGHIILEKDFAGKEILIDLF